MLDQERLIAIFEREYPSAARLAFLLTGDEVMAEDIAQTAFIRLAGRFAHIRNPLATKVYLDRIVVNLCNSYFRRRLLERSHLAGQSTEMISSCVTLPDTETQDEMWTALLRLPSRQRAALVLRYFEDLSESETGDILNCSANAVKGLTRRGLRSLRDLLEGKGPSDE